jgi:hypothetical protein
MLGALKADRAELINPTVAAHHGLFINIMYDGTLVEFAGLDAVHCAAGKEGGMGMGLPSSIVEALNGRLWAAQGSASGTVFPLAFPLAGRHDP